MSEIVLRPYQEKLIGEVHDSWKKGHKHVIMQLPTGGGKCLGVDTPVLMYDGSVKMVQDVKPGDIIMGDDSTPRNVLSTCTGKEKLYRITPVKGDSWVCNKSHILTLICNHTISKRFKKGTIYDIPIKDYYSLPNSSKWVLKQIRTGVSFKEKRTNIDPYLLGMWLAEGTKNNGSPCLTICSSDTEIIDYLRKYSTSIKNGNERDTCKSVSLCHPETGCKPNKYRNEFRKCIDNNCNVFIPKEYKINSESKRLRLLAGLLDGDGYLHHNYFEICTKFHTLSDDILYVSRSLGLAAYMRIKKVNGVPYYRINISGNIDKIPNILKRKKAHKRKQIKDVLHIGFSVEDIGNGNYYGFEIDGNHRFVLGDFTVTHNTVCFSYICQKTIENANKVLILTHRQELMDQTSGTLSKMNLSPKIIDSSTRSVPQGNCFVCMTNSLHNRMKKDVWKEWYKSISLCVIDECFTGETEILTEKGFVPFRNLGKGYRIAQFDNGNISFDYPIRYVKREHHAEITIFHAKKDIDIPMTNGHQQLFYSPKRGYYKQPISEVKFNYTKRLPLCGKSIEKSDNLSILERLYIATQADGSIHRKTSKNTIISFSFHKQRKIDRLLELCKNGDIRIHEVKCNKNKRRFLVWMPLGTTKDISNHIEYPMSCSKAQEVIDECVKWDGSVINNTMDYYSSVIKSQVDFYNSVACIAGYSCNVVIEKDNRKETFRNVYRLFINKSLVTKDTGLMYTKKEDYNGFVYCVEMPKGTIVVRHHGFTFISGNCHQQDFNWIFGLPETKQKYVIGVTATPNRTGNQRELANDYDDMVFGPDVQEMINLGYLCPDRTYSVPIDMKGVRKKGGDYDTEQMYERYNKGELYSGVISNWKKICPDTITLCFCVNIQHCINTCIAFNNAGIKAKFITSQPQKPKLTSNNKGDISLFMLKKQEYENYLSNFAKYSGKREEVISSWERGDFPVLINAGIATTGFDFPPIETIILDRATTSDNLLLQMEGRGARISDGKDYFNILDFGDNTSRLGFYRQQRDYSLYKEASRSGTGAPPVKECPKCHALVFSSSKVCKYCGYVFPQTHDEKVVELKEVAYREAVTKLDTPHDCELYAQAKGYKKNWVFRQIYIKWGLEGLQDYAKQRGLSPTWPYVIQARYSAQGIRNK